jgi:hypothetical protein
MTVGRVLAFSRRLLLRGSCILPSLLVALLAAADQRSQGANQPPLEYQVKAAFLLNFTKFVEWPAEAFPAADSPIAICISGDAPIGPALEQTVEGESVSGRKIVVQKAPPDLSKCQVLFIGRAAKEVARLLNGLGRSVLTVGEADNFLAEGGMIGFVIDNRRVRFDISQKAVAASTLKLSSKLFNVARQVEK